MLAGAVSAIAFNGVSTQTQRTQLTQRIYEFTQTPANIGTELSSFQLNSIF